MGSRTGDPPMSAFRPPTGIVLAAGLSTRMGQAKQLLPLGEGRTVLQVVVEQVRSQLESVIVVVGHRAAEVTASLADFGVECVYNREYSQGMLSSVQCGVRAARGDAGYLVCLGDQPGIRAGVIQQILAAAKGGSGIVIPCHGGRRGHPVYVRQTYADEILGLMGGAGLKAVTRGHPEDTVELEVAAPEILVDMDTPDDYARHLSRWNAGSPT